MATPDPCAALFGAMKTACENFGKTLNGSGSGGSGGIVGNLLGVNPAFDWRHFMIRTAEFGVGLMLVVVAVDAMVKNQVMPQPVVQSGKRIGKKVLK